MEKEIPETSSDITVRLANQPLIESVEVELPAPSLSDNTADLDRLAGSLSRKGFFPIQISAGKMNEFVRKMRENDLRFRAVVGYTGRVWEVLDVVALLPDAPVLGFGLDLGTSTLVLRLIDIARKKIMREVLVKNPQAAYGEDILSRIIFGGDAGGLGVLRRLLVEACSDAMEKMLRDSGVSLFAYMLYPARETRRSAIFYGALTRQTSAGNPTFPRPIPSP